MQNNKFTLSGQIVQSSVLGWLIKIQSISGLHLSVLCSCRRKCCIRLVQAILLHGHAPSKPNPESRGERGKPQQDSAGQITCLIVATQAGHAAM